MVARYGTQHPMHVEEIVDKMKQTNLERYGEEYVGAVRRDRYKK